MAKLYYITRSWSEKENANNCVLLRIAYAEMLQELFDVVVITPNYIDNNLIEFDNVIKIPYKTKNISWNYRFERVGVLEDYLDSWVKDVVDYLSRIIKADDIVYAVVGGELASIKIASIMKKKHGCKMIINFRDPVDRTIVFGQKIGDIKGLNRERKANKYIHDADGMITSSELYANVLKEKFPDKANNIYNHYLGFQEVVSCYHNKVTDKEKLNIVFSGTMTSIQNAEILYKAFKGDDRFNITFITGDSRKKKQEMPEENIHCLPLMNHEEYLNYMVNNTDIGFVSLSGTNSGVFVPSKIYDYINIGIPILGSLPKGSAKEIIESNGFGVVADEGDVTDLKEKANAFLNHEKLKAFQDCLNEKRMQWYAPNRKNEFINIINQIVNNT